MSLHVVKVKKTSIRTPLDAAGTSVKLRELVDHQGNPLELENFGEWFVLVLKQGTSIEMIKCDDITVNDDGSADCDVATDGRNISATTPYSGSSTGLDFQTAEVIVSNDPLTMSRFGCLDNANTWDEIQTFTLSPIIPAPTTDLQAATKKYADDLTYAGAPDAAEATKGVYEAATQTEVDEGDDAGTTTAPTAVRPSKVANAVQRGVWTLFTETASGDDAYTATTTPSFTPANGTMVKGSFAVGNTTGATFALNGETPVAIQKVVSGALGALETGDIIANVPLLLYRTASVWVLMSPCGSMPSTAIISELVAVLAATDVSGAELETLTAGLTSDADTLHKHSVVIDKTLGTTTVTDPVAETTVSSWTIPANTMDANSGLRLTFGFTFVTGGSNPVPIIKIKFGGTIVATFTGSAGMDAYNGFMEVVIMNNNSLSSQTARCHARASGSGTWASGDLPSNTQLITGTSAIATSSAAVLLVSFTADNNSSSMNMFEAIVERI